MMIKQEKNNHAEKPDASAIRKNDYGNRYICDGNLVIIGIISQGLQLAQLRVFIPSNLLLPPPLLMHAPVNNFSGQSPPMGNNCILYATLAFPN